jgi:hypothetical protein
MQEYDSSKKGRKDSNKNEHIHLHINVSGPLRPSQRKSQVLTTLLHGPSCLGLAYRPSSSAGGTTSTSNSFARRPPGSSAASIHNEAISDEAHVILKPRPDDCHGPLHAMMQPALYLFADEATQRRHPANKRVPRRVLLGIGVRLDPQAIAHRGDRTLE